MATKSGNGTWSTLRIWLLAILAIAGAVWGASLSPLVGIRAREEAEKVIAPLMQLNTAEHERIEAAGAKDRARIEKQQAEALKEIKESLRSIDQRLYEIARER